MVWRALVIGILLVASPLTAGEIAITIDRLFIPGTNPLKVTAGPDGRLWFINAKVSGKAQETLVGNIDSNGKVTTYPLTTTQPTIDLGAITAGPDGNLWVTYRQAPLSGGGQSGVARVSTTGAVTYFPVTGNGNPGDAITTGPDGNLWFLEAINSRAFRVTTQGVGTRFTIPSSLNFSRSIVAGPDGNLWYPMGSDIIRMTTAGVGTVFAGAATGFGITSGGDGNLWFTATNNRVARITPNGSITYYPIPTAASGPRGITSGPDGNIWFVGADSRKVGQLIVGSAAKTGPALLGEGTALVNEKPMPSGSNRLNEIVFVERTLYMNASDQSFGAELFKTSAPITPLAPDLAISKYATRGGYPFNGEAYVYYIVLSNVGPGISGDIIVKDTLPEEYTVGDTLHTPCEYASFSRTLTCAAGILAPGQRRVLILGGRLKTGHGLLRNDVTVIAEGDTNLTNNSAFHQINLDAPAVKITKFRRGDLDGWYISVKNDGIVPTNGPITIRDVLPAEVSIDSPVAAGGLSIVISSLQCTTTAGTVSCTFNESLPPGKEAFIFIPITGRPKGRIENKASVSGGGAPDAESQIDVFDSPNVVLAPPPLPAFLFSRP